MKIQSPVSNYYFKFIIYLISLLTKRNLIKIFITRKMLENSFRFVLKKFLISQLIELKDAWLAPLYFHFGHYSWFINFMSIFQDTGDTFVFFATCFGFIGGIILLRNEKFQSFTQKTYKNITDNFNFLPLSSYFDIYYPIFINLYNSVVFHFNKTYSFFKNKWKNK